jgi:hypothetical protein
MLQINRAEEATNTKAAASPTAAAQPRRLRRLAQISHEVLKFLSKIYTTAATDAREFP